ncbi:MAG: ABC transporter permease [Acidimicrobiia bacterium]|nr:ABC transporter permease [Acidimicrobiia bacterium]
MNATGASSWHPAANLTQRWPVQSAWTALVWLLLLVLLGWYSTLIPSFGSFQLASITKNSMPLAYLAIGQAVIVIAGGIDLSLGALLVLSNSLAAQLMFEQPFSATLALAVLIIGAGAVANGAVGWIVIRSGVPDIVVTLATGFIWSGLALLILPSPGGGTSEGFRLLFTGSRFSSGSNFWPSTLMLIVPMVLVAYGMRHRRQGLALYATGSDRNAAYLSGVDVRRAKIVAYAVGGAMAALSGLATVAITGSGDPRFSIGANATLNSVAAVVLGGVALTGGTGSVVGAVAGAIILFFLNPILSAMRIDPNTAQVVQGGLIVIVMMGAGFLAQRRSRST